MCLHYHSKILPTHNDEIQRVMIKVGRGDSAVIPKHIPVC